jgi:Xaa-Pro aminopeptidase
MIHGVGLADEWPQILYPQDWEGAGYDGVIEPNMVLCVESYIGREGGGQGVKLEEMVRITEDSVERLSTYPFDERLLR